MEIREIEDFFTDENKGKPWEYTHSDIEVMPVEIVKSIAVEFAKQFIDLASTRAKLVREHLDGKKESFYCVGNYHAKTIVDKQSILDIKQLIK